MRVIIARLVIVQAQLVVKALRRVAVAGGGDVLRIPLACFKIVSCKSLIAENMDKDLQLLVCNNESALSHATENTKRKRNHYCESNGSSYRPVYQLNEINQRILAYLRNFDEIEVSKQRHPQ
jgi:hypothetical protein